MNIYPQQTNMTIQDIIEHLESIAAPALQESYDNARLLVGDKQWECTGVLTALDSTEGVIDEAISNNCNLIVAHHPIIFGGLKSITGKSYIERTIIKAIKNDVAIYAIHTNLDNVSEGVNKVIADKLGLIHQQILSPKNDQLRKLAVYVPIENRENLQEALFAAGAGHIGKYSECSFSVAGTGTFLPGEGASPAEGAVGSRSTVKEEKLEVLYPVWKETAILSTMKANHPYEEVAYECYAISNLHQNVGSGMIGQLPQPVAATDFLKFIKERFGLAMLKHTTLLEKPIRKVAVCGGAGSFLLQNAIAAGADIFITSDMKYHEFFDADGKIIVVDIGHYESEQFTVDLLYDILREKFTNFAVQKTTVNTNPVSYF